MKNYSAEYYELMDFLAAQKIKGVVFITGDRHHSEVIKLDRPGLYPLYDITTSPFTAGVSKVSGIELNSPVRIKGTLVQEQNFAKITVSGKKNERVFKVEFIGIKGDKLGEWSTDEKELNFTTNAVK
jgi:alkaline phosphatase D